MTSGAQRAKVEVALAYDQRADAAAASVLRRLRAVIVENVDGAVAGADTEYLHQLRIAVRRSRTVQRQLRGVFPALELPGWHSDFRWLQRATGEARDLDVYVEELGPLRKLLPETLRDDLDPLRPVLVHWQLAARGQMAATLRSRRAVDLLQDWERLLESLVELGLDERPEATRPVGELAGRRIRVVYDRIVSMGAAIGEASPREDYHELRKQGKELRYLLELFGLPVFGAETVEPLVSSLKGLQDVLGRHQDRVVQIALLRSLVDEVATLPRGPAACMAMGALADRLRADELAARREFCDRFALVAGEGTRSLVEGLSP